MKRMAITHESVFLICCIVVSVSIMFLTGCSSGGSDDGTDTTATIHAGDSWRSVKVTIDDSSSWFEVIDSTTGTGDVTATLTRESDDVTMEGQQIVLAYTEDEQNLLTFSNSTYGIGARGRLNRAGDTYMVRGQSLEDSEGELQVGIQNAVGAGNSTLNGSYLVSMVHSDTSQVLGFFSGTYTMTFNTGTVAIATLDSDRTPATDYTGSYTYTISSEGLLTISDATFPRDLIGAVREDGELFVLADTRGDPGTSTTDNSVKTIFVGVRKSTAAGDELLSGSWDLGSICSGNQDASPISWSDDASTLVLDAEGDGTFTDTDGTTGPISIDLNTDGTFSLAGFNSVGAITPSGDLLIVVNNTLSADSDYCLSVGVKLP